MGEGISQIETLVEWCQHTVSVCHNLHPSCHMCRHVALHLTDAVIVGVKTQHEQHACICSSKITAFCNKSTCFRALLYSYLTLQYQAPTSRVRLTVGDDRKAQMQQCLSMLSQQAAPIIRLSTMGHNINQLNHIHHIKL